MNHFNLRGVKDIMDIRCLCLRERRGRRKGGALSRATVCQRKKNFEAYRACLMADTRVHAKNSDSLVQAMRESHQLFRTFHVIALRKLISVVDASVGQ